MTLRTPKKHQGPTKSHARAKRQEKEIAERIGGRLTPGSGSKYQKGDVRVRGFARIEAKTTKNKSFSVSTKLIDKLEEAVFGSDEIPFFEIELGLGSHTAVVLPREALDEIIEMQRRLKELESVADRQA